LILVFDLLGVVFGLLKAKNNKKKKNTGVGWVRVGGF